jgi:hypothetical protein
MKKALFPSGWSPGGNRAPSQRGACLFASGEYSPNPPSCKDGAFLGKDPHVSEPVWTTDLYESTFYLLGGCQLVAIEAEKVDGAIICRLSFQGEKLPQLQSEYFAGKAKVALFPFRRAFGQVNALVYSAKKKAKSQLRQAQATEGGTP